MCCRICRRGTLNFKLETRNSLCRMFDLLADLPLLSTRAQLDDVRQFLSQRGPAADAPELLKARLLGRLTHEVEWVETYEPGLCTMLSAGG